MGPGRRAISPPPNVLARTPRKGGIPSKQILRSGRGSRSPGRSHLRSPDLADTTIEHRSSGGFQSVESDSDLFTVDLQDRRTRDTSHLRARGQAAQSLLHVLAAAGTLDCQHRVAESVVMHRGSQPESASQDDPSNPLAASPEMGPRVRNPLWITDSAKANHGAARGSQTCRCTSGIRAWTDWRPSGCFRIEPRTRGGSVTRRAQARRVRSTACAPVPGVARVMWGG